MQFSQYLKVALVSICLALAPNSQAAEKDAAKDTIVVFAAASLTNAINEISANYEQEKGAQIKSSFAASSALAKQIENGAPADIFISADTKWMNYLKDKQALKDSTVANLLTNHLVLIAPAGKRFDVTMNKSFDFFGAFNGKLCTGEMASVPVGIYAKQALTSLAWLDAGQSRIVGTQDVRAALTLVERAECATGIVYETDAKISNKVDVIATFPDNTHEPILYPLALTKSASAKSADFYDYLKSEKAKVIFTKYGFSFIEKNLAKK
nr:molybdate ABC transporter substrate-binding protein [uncultured Methylotenera sp.]